MSTDVGDEHYTFPVTFDPDTIEWLRELSAETGKHPRVLVASMIQALRRDDQAAHGDESGDPQLEVPDGTTVH